MNLPESDFQILRLTDDFYKAYPNPPYREILQKRQRAYNCVLFQTHYDYYICVPYRSEISHKYAYLFKKSARSMEHRSGLDYTKILIINKGEYIGSIDALVEQDEFNETMINLRRIKREALKYVEDYVAHMKGLKVLSSQEFNRRYNFSTLKYFHMELGI